MKTIRIDYHSGTGGSEMIAKLLANILNTHNIHIDVRRIFRENIVNTQILDIDYYILIFPVHSFSAPLPVYEWVAHLEGNHCNTAVISVSGGGNILSISASRYKTVKLLQKSQCNIIYEAMVRMPNNWVKVPDKEEIKRLLSNLPAVIDKIAKDILTEKNEKQPIYWIDYLISALGEVEKRGTKKFGNRIKVLDNCVGCGLCSQNCCSSNIIMEDQNSRDRPAKPIFGNRCDMCLGCIYNCPQKAILPIWGAFQVDKKGYNLPY